MRVILSGGGTGGHIFPAIAIAQEIQRRVPHAEFLFIGAEGKMEMEKVPQAGFAIEGLPIRGFDRSNLFKNLSLPFKLMQSAWKVRRLIKDFRPDFAIGTGGFASGPALFVSAKMGVPIFIQEQNSIPGKTNSINAKFAQAVFTAFPDMQGYFPQSKVLFLGNPVRSSIHQTKKNPKEAKRSFGLDEDKFTILSVGGSLGAKTLNDAWGPLLDLLSQQNIQLIWQTGKLYTTAPNEMKTHKHVVKQQFITDMATAYSAADLVVSRAGAIAISELALAEKASILVPYPFAAEDHQTKNALALSRKGAAVVIKDKDMPQYFAEKLLEICQNQMTLFEMKEKIQYFAKLNANQDIVREIFKTLNIHA